MFIENNFISIHFVFFILFCIFCITRHIKLIFYSNRFSQAFSDPWFGELFCSAIRNCFHRCMLVHILESSIREQYSKLDHTGVQKRVLRVLRSSHLLGGLHPAPWPIDSEQGRDESRMTFAWKNSVYCRSLKYKTLQTLSRNGKQRNRSLVFHKIRVLTLMNRGALFGIQVWPNTTHPTLWCGSLQGLED